jgi:hypothetical protein
MEEDQQPQADLELGNETNPPMPNARQADPSKNESPEDFFSRVLSGGQIEQTTGVESPEAPEAETPEATTEAEDAEQQYDDSQDRSTKGVQKRLAKLTALRREAEEKASRLEQEVAELKRSKVVEKAQLPNQFAQLESITDIQAEFERQRKIRLFCERYPDGYYPEGEGEPVSKENMSKAKVRALQAIEEDLPRQLAYVEEKNKAMQFARSEFSWLADHKDERTTKVKAFIDAVPEIKRFPDYEIYAAHMVNGMTSYKAQKSMAQKSQGRVPVQPTMSSVPAPRQPQKSDPVQYASSVERYRRSGSIDDLADVFKNKFI